MSYRTPMRPSSGYRRIVSEPEASPSFLQQMFENRTPVDSSKVADVVDETNGDANEGVSELLSTIGKFFSDEKAPAGWDRNADIEVRLKKESWGGYGLVLKQRGDDVYVYDMVPNRFMFLRMSLQDSALHCRFVQPCREEWHDRERHDAHLNQWRSFTRRCEPRSNAREQYLA